MSLYFVGGLLVAYSKVSPDLAQGTQGNEDAIGVLPHILSV
jgi:hypothetical protein